MTAPEAAAEQLYLDRQAINGYIDGLLAAIARERQLSDRLAEALRRLLVGGDAGMEVDEALRQYDEARQS